jgi:hypothetical protein
MASSIAAQRRQLQQAIMAGVQRHKMLYITVGGVLGVGVTGASIYLLVERNPSIIERIIAEKTAKTFSTVLDFDSRKQIFHRLPEYNVPMPELPITNTDSVSRSNKNVDPLLLWSHTVQKSFKDIESSFLVQVLNLDCCSFHNLKTICRPKALCENHSWKKHAASII